MKKFANFWPKPWKNVRFSTFLNRCFYSLECTVAHNCHGKTKNLTAKPNTSQQKPNTSRQKQIATAKPKLFCFCCEEFGFAVRYFVFAVMFLVLPWGFFFVAVRFLVLPWQLWATIPNGCFQPRRALKLKIFLSLFGQNRKAAVNGVVWFTNSAIMVNNYEEASGTLAKPHVYN